MGAWYSDPVRGGPRQLQRVQQGEDQDDRRRLRRLWRWNRAHPQDAWAHAWTPGPAASAEEVRHRHPLRRSLPPAGQPQVPPHPNVQLLARRDAGLDRPHREDRQEQEGAAHRAARPERFRRPSQVPGLSRIRKSRSDPDFPAADFYGFAYSTNWLLPSRMIHCPMPRPSWSPFGVKSQVEPAPWKLIAVPARTSFNASTTSSTSWPGPLPTGMICFDQSTAIGLFAFSIASAVMAIWSCVLGGKRSTRSEGAPMRARNFL